MTIDDGGSADKRYFVDERGGCVAVRDRQKTDPQYSGLHEDTDGVMWFRMGQQVSDKCPTCGHINTIGWRVGHKLIRQAHEEAARLNSMLAESRREKSSD